MEPTFNDFPLALLNPSFDSDLIDVLTELEKLRTLRLGGDVHPQIFMQLKTIFHMLESIGSARIEGNHTTLADYVESQLENAPQPSEQLAEIRNIETAMRYIGETLGEGDPISEHFIRELHSLTVNGLQREGDKTPGQYRQHAVAIAQSSHLPPEAIRVADYMQELVAFINQPDKPKYDLMKIALAHHRFGWIHPFGNGNGRTVRLLTYALLVKYGFNVKRILQRPQPLLPNALAGRQRHAARLGSVVYLCAVGHFPRTAKSGQAHRPHIFEPANIAPRHPVFPAKSTH